MEFIDMRSGMATASLSHMNGILVPVYHLVSTVGMCNESFALRNVHVFQELSLELLLVLGPFGHGCCELLL
jgi:hypothetical protein